MRESLLERAVALAIHKRRARELEDDDADYDDEDDGLRDEDRHAPPPPPVARRRLDQLPLVARAGAMQRARVAADVEPVADDPLSMLEPDGAAASAIVPGTFVWDGEAFETTVVVDSWDYPRFEVRGQSATRTLDLTPYRTSNPDRITVVLRGDGPVDTATQRHTDTHVIIERRPDLAARPGPLVTPDHWARVGQPDQTALRRRVDVLAAPSAEGLLPWGYERLHVLGAESFEPDTLALSPEGYARLTWVTWTDLQNVVRGPREPPECVACRTPLSDTMLALDCSTAQHIHALCRGCAPGRLCAPFGTAGCPRCRACVSVRELGTYPLIARRVREASRDRDVLTAVVEEVKQWPLFTAARAVAARWVRDKECPNCQVQNLQSAVTCLGCGHRFASPADVQGRAAVAAVCGRCELSHAAQTKICHACSAPLSSASG
jgi:hypothetical protein